MNLDRRIQIRHVNVDPPHYLHHQHSSPRHNYFQTKNPTPPCDTVVFHDFSFACSTRGQLALDASHKHAPLLGNARYSSATAAATGGERRDAAVSCLSHRSQSIYPSHRTIYSLGMSSLYIMHNYWFDETRRPCG